MASIVKKMMKEIGIRLCLGVDRELVRPRPSSDMHTGSSGRSHRCYRRICHGLCERRYALRDGVPLWVSAGAVGFAMLARCWRRRFPASAEHLHPLEVIREEAEPRDDDLGLGQEIGLSEQLEAARARCLSFSLAYLRLLRAVWACSRSSRVGTGVGSAAGTAGKDSDVDLLIIKRSHSAVEMTA